MLAVPSSHVPPGTTQTVWRVMKSEQDQTTSPNKCSLFEDQEFQSVQEIGGV